MNIKVKNVSIELSKRLIVKDASLEVKDSEIVGIIGPNGSGKSTLLKSIYRINKIKSGEILINDVNLDKISFKDFSKDIGVLSQFNNVAFDMSVLDMVLLGRSPHKGLFDDDTEEDLNISLEALKKVGMLEFKDRSFLKLSGGEKQRVLLARVLTQGVKLLILDEPTNHLDIKYAIETLKIVKSLKIPALIALHDLNLAANFCTTIHIMNEGSIKYSGKPKEILIPSIIKEIYDVDVSIQNICENLNIIFKLK